jgi:tRNA threonylcarbamoyladenosine biosynthesis protein TsaE
VRREIVGEQAQEAFGTRLAARLRAPCVIYLVGDLGTGKTTLVRGMLRGLGHRGSVRSPTYTLLEPYELGDLRLFHLDLYRLGDPEELEYLGLRDLLETDTVLLVEWPERGAGVLPPADLEVRLDYAGIGRLLHLTPRTDTGAALLAAVSDPLRP